jgi:hypothetical protein
MNYHSMRLPLRPVVTIPTNVDWSEAFKALVGGDVKESLRRAAAAGVELYDYRPLDERFRMLADAIRKQFNIESGEDDEQATAQTVRVIPRGSFASRTALTKTASIDVELLIHKDYKLEIADPKTSTTEMKTVGEWLGTDRTGPVSHSTRQKMDW